VSALALVASPSCRSFGSDFPEEYVDFYVTAELVDADGAPATCGALGVVQVSASTGFDGPRMACCPPAESSVRIILLPDEYEHGTVTVDGFAKDGRRIAEGVASRQEADREIAVELSLLPPKPGGQETYTTIVCHYE